jgi:preprotein translocase subunit YajC
VSFLIASPLLAAATTQKGSSITPLILFVGLGVVTYLMLIRPQRNRMKKLRETQAVLAPGAEVVTTAGLYATVVDTDEETVTLETSPGVYNRYVRAAVARIVTPTAEPPLEQPSNDGLSPEN